jgi:uncharacterized membrane protein YfcA
MSDWTPHLVLAGIGLVSGTLNVIAGGGSFLTVPMLIFFGLPATVANATNRVGVLAQCAGAVWGFHRHRVLDWPTGLRTAVPAVLGALAGTGLALVISDRAFTRVLAVCMLALTAATFWHRKGAPAASEVAAERARSALYLVGFFLIGLYSGFVQAGVGFLILGATSLVGLDLVRGNALKVLVVVASQAVALGIFAAGGKVSWPMAVSLAIGMTLGGQLGVRLTVAKGHAWLRNVVTVVVVLFALKLLLVP